MAKCVVLGALEISEDVFSGSIMKNGGIVVELCKPGDGVCEIWMGDNWKMHERADDLAILFGVESLFEFLMLVELYLIFERCFSGIAMVHVEFVKETTSVCVLWDRNWTSRMTAVDIDVEKFLNRTKIANRKSLREFLMYKVDFFDSFGKYEYVVNVDCNDDKCRSGGRS